LPGLIDLVPNAVAATLLFAIASPALPRSRHGLQGGAAPPDQVTHGVMTGVGPKTGLNCPPSEGARGGCITPVFLHLIAGLGPDQRRRHHVAPVADANSFGSPPPQRARAPRHYDRDPLFRE
jgi:hypothetical protein